ncbi:MAG: hypothetical protein ABEJ27_03760 [Halodesulfurarchaeum sp.]
MGILRMAKRAVLLAFTLPPLVLGVERVLRGDPWGWGFLGLAGLFLGFNLVIETPEDVPILVVERVAGWLTGDGK